MKKFRRLAFLSVLFILVFASVPAAAETQEFSAQYLKLEVPDNVITLTQGTSKNDPIWTQCGITSPAAKLDEFKDMGTVAYYFDTISKTGVSLIAKKSTKTASQFQFVGMTDAEIIDFMTDVMGGDAEEYDFAVEMYPHHQLPFFRLQLNVTVPDAEATEIIYGTMVNGMMLQFDMYTNGTELPDEAFIRSLVDSSQVTKVMTYEEYEEQSRKGMIQFAAVLGAIVLILVLIFVLSSLHNKHVKNKARAISEAMQDFRKRRIDNPSDFSGAPVATGETIYVDAMVDDYIVYNLWKKPILKLSATAIFMIALISLMLKYDSTAYAIITASLALVVIYMNYSRGEKTKSALKKQYETSRKPRVIFRFYNEYFTVTGLGSISEYIYKQVTDIRENEGLVYIYLGNENALFLNRESLQGMGVNDLKKLIQRP